MRRRPLVVAGIAGLCLVAAWWTVAAVVQAQKRAAVAAQAQARATQTAQAIAYATNVAAAQSTREAAATATAAPTATAQAAGLPRPSEIARRYALPASVVGAPLSVTHAYHAPLGDVVVKYETFPLPPNDSRSIFLLLDVLPPGDIDLTSLLATGAEQGLRADAQTTIMGGGYPETVPLPQATYPRARAVWRTTESGPQGCRTELTLATRRSAAAISILDFDTETCGPWGDRTASRLARALLQRIP